MDANYLRNELSLFTGTENYYRHPFNRQSTYTDGVKHFCEIAGGGAYWLLDILMTEPEILKQQLNFASIKFVVADSVGVLTVNDGNDSPPVFTREIEWTTTPDGEWGFYFTDNVLMLPSEY